MIDTWNASGDFAHVVDTLEQVTLFRLGCLDSPMASEAWRFEEEISASRGPGGFERTTTTWQIPSTEVAASLSPGDRLRDSQGRCGTIVSIEPLSGSTRQRCRVVRFGGNPSTLERFDWSRPTQEGTTLVRPAVEGVWLSRGSVPESATIYTLEETPAQPGDRLTRYRDGESYEIQTVNRPEALGDPWEVEATRLVDSP